VQPVCQCSRCFGEEEEVGQIILVKEDATKRNAVHRDLPLTEGVTAFRH
jgi:hypothetical protein